MATNECIKELLHVKNRAADLGMPDALETNTVFNDNQAAVNWAASVTNKGTKHINLRENKVREAVADGSARVRHIDGIINVSDIFTKELKDGAHFRRLRDAMMVSQAAFDRHHHTVPSHAADRDDKPYFCIRSHDLPQNNEPSSELPSESAFTTKPNGQPAPQHEPEPRVTFHGDTSFVERVPPLGGPHPGLYPASWDGRR